MENKTQTREIVMTLGLPASGKSTWAKEKVAKSNGKWKRINKDDLRDMIDAGVWSRPNEEGILQVQTALVTNFMLQGLNVIVDDTNFAPKHQERIKEIIGNFNKASDITKYELKIQDFTDVPLETCLERDAKRAKPVGEKVIRQMYNQYLKPKKKEGSNHPIQPPKFNPALPTVVICDLDGTIADMGERDPYNASTCYLDTPRKHVVVTLKALLSSEEINHIIFFSGREDSENFDIFTQTHDWLTQKCGFKPFEFSLYLRAYKDQRKDSVVKEEMYHKYIENRFNILAVFDDRKQVIRECWYKLGLPVFACGDIDANF